MRKMPNSQHRCSRPTWQPYQSTAPTPTASAVITCTVSQVSYPPPAPYQKGGHRPHALQPTRTKQAVRSSSPIPDTRFVDLVYRRIQIGCRRRGSRWLSDGGCIVGHVVGALAGICKISGDQEELFQQCCWRNTATSKSESQQACHWWYASVEPAALYSTEPEEAIQCVNSSKAARNCQARRRTQTHRPIRNNEARRRVTTPAHKTDGQQKIRDAPMRGVAVKFAVESAPGSCWLRQAEHTSQACHAFDGEGAVEWESSAQ